MIAPLLGKVPYLNGGLFALHQVEQANPDIDIPDEAFTQVFAFFDEWDWTLDTRTTRSGKEINPDILGHIFEKYINQKDTGAYYTKEDITEYIAKNTILPFLLARAAGDVAIAFEPSGAAWRLLSENPDRYIHDALLRGVDVPLPPGIAAGEDDARKRGSWDRSADPAYAPPGETWREHLARRWRCRDLRARLRDGQVHTVDDLVTLNLNIRQFAQDVVAYSEGPEIVSSLYRALEQLTVLDPTCGSGAFLFAALNVLKPVYDACLDRMQGFVDETDALGGASNGQGQRRFEYFRAILARMSGHPNRDYFVLKSIILDNLYGVDLMGEAVEICKLRLFLKLASHVEPVAAKPNYGLEPLPDIDFNIRAGNTLVGFTTDEEVRQALTSRFDLPGEVARIAKHAATVEGSFKAFREMQTRPDLAAGALGEKKRKLSEELATLGDALDRYLAAEHGVNPASGEAFAQWRTSHRPFHWLSEFHGIMKGGGFDVIIGNPPWKEYAAVRGSYTVRGYETEKCGNLHAMCTERALHLRSPHGWASFIVQLPLVSSSRMVSARNLLRRSSDALFVATFDDRPGKLFDGLQHCRSVIFLSRNGTSSKRGFLATTRYQRWPTASRDDLFAKLEYAKALADPILPGLFPKYANGLEEALFAKVKTRGRQTVGFALSKRPTKNFIFYQEATQYWIKATVGLPYYAKNGVVGAPAHGRYLYFPTAEEAHAACALLNSNLFYAYFIAYGDCFHLSDMLVANFPVPPGLLGDPVLQKADERLMADLMRTAETKTIRTSDGNAISYAEFYGARSKPIIDEIDRLLAKHYDFTDEELDFVTNYDIKYRMGREADAEGEG